MFKKQNHENTFFTDGEKGDYEKGGFWKRRIMKKKDDSLRQILLDTARLLADEEGIEKLNIRSIARRAGVASGTVYNYFSSKDEILLALTKEYWQQALLEMDTAITADSFCQSLSEMCSYLKKRMQQSAGALMNSLSSVQHAGQESMASAQEDLKAILIRWMEQDADIPDRIWDENFTKERFAEFIRMNLTELLKAPDVQTEFFIGVIRRVLNGKGNENKN